MNVATVSLGLLALIGAAAGAGTLDPSAAPASTPNLADPRTPLSPEGPFPIVISQPGSYYLTGNISGVFGSSAIRIDAPDVTLDLSGFTVAHGVGAEQNPSSGIYTTQGRVTVRNGVVIDWTRHSIESTGDDFVFEDLRLFGADNEGLSAVGFGDRISRCTVSHCGGILIQTGDCAIVEDCIVHDSPSSGIYAAFGATVQRCQVANCMMGIGHAGAGRVRDCFIRNVVIGITGESYMLIQNNQVLTASLYGIVSESRCNVEDNSISSVHGTNAAAISSTFGNLNRFERNTMTDCDAGIASAGGHNFFDQNTFLNVPGAIGNAGGDVLGPTIIPSNSTTTTTSTWNAQP